MTLPDNAGRYEAPVGLPVIAHCKECKHVDMRDPHVDRCAHDEAPADERLGDAVTEPPPSWCPLRAPATPAPVAADPRSTLHSAMDDAVRARIRRDVALRVARDTGAVMADEREPPNAEWAAYVPLHRVWRQTIHIAHDELQRAIQAEAWPDDEVNRG